MESLLTLSNNRNPFQYIDVQLIEISKSTRGRKSPNYFICKNKFKKTKDLNIFYLANIQNMYLTFKFEKVSIDSVQISQNKLF